jgi:hypothetical protein
MESPEKSIGDTNVRCAHFVLDGGGDCDHINAAGGVRDCSKAERGNCRCGC